MSDQLGHPYSTVRRTSGRPAYVSGVLPYRADGSLAGDRDEAIAAVLSTMKDRLEAEGTGMDQVAKATVFLTDMGWLQALNAAWLEAFVPPRPARSTIEVRALPRGAAIEVEAILDLPA